MRKNIVYLSLAKAIANNIIVDYKEYFKKWDNSEARGYVLLRNAPQVINIEGHYVLANRIKAILPFTKRHFLDICELTDSIVEYRWKR